MIAWPHFLHDSVASGGRSPEMKTLVLQLLQVTILSGALSLIVARNQHQSFPQQRPQKQPEPALQCGKITLPVVIFTPPVKAGISQNPGS
jgi:hypothetical protein